jgi:hypothetical protein
MKRIYPHRIQDKLHLSRLLEAYLRALEHSPLQVRLQALSFDTQIPESIFLRLMALHHTPNDMQNIDKEDFYILFANIGFRYPTVKMWEQEDGTVFFEM